MESAVNQMTHIHAQVKTSQGQVRDFEQQADEVTELVTMIRQISQQTNLLALNAAIEAVNTEKGLPSSTQRFGNFRIVSLSLSVKFRKSSEASNKTRLRSVKPLQKV